MPRKTEIHVYRHKEYPELLIINIGKRHGLIISTDYYRDNDRPIFQEIIEKNDYHEIPKKSIYST